MTVGISAYLANSWLNTVRGTAPTVPSSLFVKLHIGDPGAAGTANPSAVVTRQPIAYAAASGGSMSLTGTPPVWTMTATETLSHISVWDASTNGNFLLSAALASTKPVGAGDTYTLSTDSLALTAIAA